MKQLAVFASGTGTNFVAIAKACQSGQLDARVALMVCDCPGAPVIDRAAEMGIESFVFSPKDYLTKADFEAVIVKLLDEIPEEQAEVIRLRIYGDNSFAEVADILSVPLPTVKSRFLYGLEKIRKAMKTN